MVLTQHACVSYRVVHTIQNLRASASDLLERLKSSGEPYLAIFQYVKDEFDL